MFYPMFTDFSNLFSRLCCAIVFAEWNSVHLFLYNELSRNAHRRIFVDCAALRFIINIRQYSKLTNLLAEVHVQYSLILYEVMCK